MAYSEEQIREVEEISRIEKLRRYRLKLAYPYYHNWNKKDKGMDLAYMTEEQFETFLNRVKDK